MEHLLAEWADDEESVSHYDDLVPPVGSYSYSDTTFGSEDVNELTLPDQNLLQRGACSNIRS